MRVFIGVSEIANFVASYKQGFEAIGCETFTLLKRRNHFYPTAKYDVVISERLGYENTHASIFSKISTAFKISYWSLHSFLTALLSCDVFVYIGGESLLPGYLDYFLIKLFRKKLVGVFLGSDIRYRYAFQQEMEQLGKLEKVTPFIEAIKDKKSNYYRAKRKRISQVESRADLILSQPGFAQLQTRPYMRVKVCMNLERHPFNVNENSAPLVLHAPSSRGIKGTHYIIKAVEQLRKEGLQFEFELVERMPHSDLISLLAKSDIVVDELHSDTVGVLSTEAMAAGNAVLTSYYPNYIKMPGDCPAVPVDTDNLVDCLRQVIIDPEMRRRLAHEGRKYVAQHHDSENITRQILEWLKPDRNREYDFTPTFYKTLTIPPGILLQEKARSKEKKYKRISNLFKAIFGISN